jgi:hypothetical protein
LSVPEAEKISKPQSPEAEQAGGQRGTPVDLTQGAN